MLKFSVVPDVIPSAPRGTLKITYLGGKINVESGNLLTPTQVKDMPTVDWNADRHAYYTLCMTDPDNPSREEPSLREWVHWLVVNIPGKDIAKGDVLAEFLGSGPILGTGLHRYVFLVYLQPGRIACSEPRLPNTTGAGRAHFSIKTFAEKYNLGDPVAGNLYQAEWDEYVITFYKNLK